MSEYYVSFYPDKKRYSYLDTLVTTAYRPGSLQQHDGVLALVGAGGGHEPVRERQVGGQHVPVSAAREARALHAARRVRRARRLQAARQRVQLRTRFTT